MKILPDQGALLARCLGIVLVVAALAVGCGISAKKNAANQTLPDRTVAFLQSRSQPALPSAAKGDASAEQDGAKTSTIDVIGAVERPGQLVIGQYVQTMRQAVDAMGGVGHEAVMLRIRPGDDALRQLVAEPDDSTAVEIPIAMLDEPNPIYVRSGDIVEVVADTVTPVEAPAVVPTGAPVVALPTQTQQPATPEELKLVNATPASPPAESPPGNLTENPVAEATQKPPPAPVAAQPELAALRAEMDRKFQALEQNLAKLEEENAKLRARLGQTSPPTAPSAGAAVAKKPLPPADGRRAEPAKPRPAVAEKPAPKTDEAAQRDPAPAARSATVMVSGSVKNPGSYAIDQVKTVRGAVRAAGDRNDANLQAVEVRPEGQRGPLTGIGLGLGSSAARTVVDLVAVEAGKGRDLPLRGGEVIFVPPAPASEPRR